MRALAFIVGAVIGLSGLAYAQSTPPATNAAQFISISAEALMSSRGLNVRNAEGENIGKPEDIAFEAGRLIGVVLSVEDTAGRYVAIDPSSISIRYIEGENTWQATVNAKIDQLRMAPEFRYEGKWKR